MKKTKCFRHGDVVLMEIKNIPKEAKLSSSNILMVGSHQNNHSFKGGQFYDFKKENIVGYLKAKDTKLFHPEHSPKGVKIPNGNYAILKQQEFTPQGLIPVID